MGDFFKIPLLGSILANLGAMVLLLSLAGCASVGQPHRDSPGPASADVRDCAKLFGHYDAAVDEAGIRDAAAHRIAGFPYLRIDRFLASFRGEAGSDGKVFAAWLGQLQGLATQARRYELANLPASFGLKEWGDEKTVASKLDLCADRLAAADIASPARRETLLAHAQVPDEYSDLARALGIYPVTRIPFYAGVSRWQRDTLEQFRQARPETDAETLRYVPAADTLDSSAIQALFTQSSRDALGIPQFGPAALASLFDAFAPVYEIETTGDFDRIGSLVWQGGASPTVQASRPTVYRRLAFTRFHGQVLPQLVYTVWFPERPASGAFDLLSGRLDGLVFRVTLDGRGRPLVYDSIHPCGCYHLFFPTDRMRALPAPGKREEWAFIPKNAPELGDAQRLALRVASRTHYLVGLRPDSGRGGVAYSFAWEDGLRSLPDVQSDATRSAFGADGMVPGTGRAERFLFWPMGIANSGAMRQWGKHATAFVGRRHFDDADLIEKRFAVSP